MGSVSVKGESSAPFHSQIRDNSVFWGPVGSSIYDGKTWFKYGKSNNNNNIIMTMTSKGQSEVKWRMWGSRIDEFKRYKVSDRTLPLCPRPVCIHRVPWCALTSFMGNVADRVDYSPFFVVSAQPRKPTPSTPFTHFLRWPVCKVTAVCSVWVELKSTC